MFDDERFKPVLAGKGSGRCNNPPAYDSNPFGQGVHRSLHYKTTH
jgi:hypothetical protein